MRRFSMIAASFIAWSVSAPAQAQTFGPPIPGMCLLSRMGAINASRAGQTMRAMLGQMQTSLNGELAQRRGALEQQRRLLETRQNATAPIEYQRQLAAIDQQAQLLEQQQNARFIAAQTQSQQQIDHALNDALARVVTRAACSLVLDRDHSYGWNNAMDVTAAVTKEMDTILPSVVLQ